MRTFALGDIHGRHKALKQVLERAEFDYEQDRLIFLGDVLDRGSEPFDCILELLQIKNRILIVGNHDLNFHNYTISGHDMFNGSHGAGITKLLWQQQDTETKMMCGSFFKEQRYYYVDEKNNCYVHGGFDRWETLERQDEYNFCWDRKLWEQAKSVRGEGVKLKTVDDFNMVFIGHTPTAIDTDAKGNPITTPLKFGGVWNLDTGAGFYVGKLTMMNVATQEYFQSDFIHELYKEDELQR